MNPYTPPNSLENESTTQSQATFLKEDDGQLILKPCLKKVKQVQILKTILYFFLSVILLGVWIIFSAICLIVAWREYKKIKDFKENRLKLSDLTYKDKSFSFAFGQKTIEVSNIQYLETFINKILIKKIEPSWADKTKIDKSIYKKTELKEFLSIIKDDMATTA